MYAVSVSFAATPVLGIATGRKARSQRQTRFVGPRSRTLRTATCAAVGASDAQISERTKRLLRSIEGVGGTQASGAGGGTTLAALERADQAWHAIRNMKVGEDAGPAPVFVTESSEAIPASKCDFDVAVCGGTLGIIIATALQHLGQNVVVVERGLLKGREQEWNVSRPELNALVPLGVLTPDQVDECITTEFNPIKCFFFGSEAPPMVTQDILNCGVKPSLLLRCIKKNFEDKGGLVMERAALGGIVVHPNGTELDISPAPVFGETDENKKEKQNSNVKPVTARLVVDCMGFGSPVVKQQRHGVKPDGVCLVVGSCARGFDSEQNRSADLIATTTDIQPDFQGQVRVGAFPHTNTVYGPCVTIVLFTTVNIYSTGNSYKYITSALFGPNPATCSARIRPPCLLTQVTVPTDLFLFQTQYFWEAFPAGSGPLDRTTYMFTYVDADSSRPSLAKVLDDYWDLMPSYQNLKSIEEVELLRVLFGYFPTYRDSPMQTQFDRICSIGDASGAQSPLSFGGLGALLRHVGRLSNGMEDALLSDCLDKECLAKLNPYQPALSASWLFQKCMSVAPGATPPKNFINELMATNFGVMEGLGDTVSRPFLQDVVQFKGLGSTLLGMALKAPLFVPQILVQAGPGPVLDWCGHFFNLGVYTVLSVLSETGVTGEIAAKLAGVAPTSKLLISDQNAVQQAGWDFSILDQRQRFMFRRRLDAWRWGSGRDYDGN